MINFDSVLNSIRNNKIKSISSLSLFIVIMIIGGTYKYCTYDCKQVEVQLQKGNSNDKVPAALWVRKSTFDSIFEKIRDNNPQENGISDVQAFLNSVSIISKVLYNLNEKTISGIAVHENNNNNNNEAKLVVTITTAKIQ